MLLTAWPWKANTTLPYNAQYGVGYALCKLQGQWSQLWRDMEASHCSHALAMTRNAISEAMNVFMDVKIKCEDADVARASNILSPSMCIYHTCNKWLAQQH